MVKLPPVARNDITKANEVLDKILDDCDQDYLGTDPVDDLEQSFREKQMKNYGLKETDFKSGSESQLKSKIKDLIAAKFGKKSKNEWEDPFATYGFAITAYFRLIKSLIIVFTIISLLFMPVLITYNRYGALNDQSSFFVFGNTLGNLGHAHS